MSDIVKRLAKCAAVSEIIKDNPKLYYDAMYEIERLRAENEKLQSELEMMRKACRKACKANYKLGIDKGEEKAIIRMREIGE